MRPRLRLFTGDGESVSVEEPKVSIPLGDITSVLAEAIEENRSWVSDFEDDQIEISADLYDVLSAYWHLRPSA